MRSVTFVVIRDLETRFAREARKTSRSDFAVKCKKIVKHYSIYRNSGEFIYILFRTSMTCSEDIIFSVRTLLRYSECFYEKLLIIKLQMLRRKES